MVRQNLDLFQSQIIHLLYSRKLFYIDTSNYNPNNLKPTNIIFINFFHIFDHILIRIYLRKR